MTQAIQCPVCGGKGTLKSPDYPIPTICPVCQGKGWILDSDIVEAEYNRR